MIAVRVSFDDGNDRTSGNVDGAQSAHLHHITVHFHFMNFSFVSNFRFDRNQLINFFARIFESFEINRAVFTACQ